MNVDLPEDSDSSDEDYVPNEKSEDLPSEIEEDDSISEGEGSNEKFGKKRKTRKKKSYNAKKQKLVSENKNEPVTDSAPENKGEVEDLWADFVKDTGFKSKASANQPEGSKPKQNIIKTKSSEPSNTHVKPLEKVKITQIFEFAGEEVKVEKEVNADSAEARLLDKNCVNTVSANKNRRSAGLSGISNVLNQLTKKSKISTLEKTKLDWDTYKREHKIEEDLHTFNKGKDGYLERQDFLQRTDLRRFEIEKTVREVERSKRFNST